MTKKEEKNENNSLKIMIAALAIAALIIMATVLHVGGTLSGQITNTLTTKQTTTQPEATTQPEVTPTETTQNKTVTLNAKDLIDDDPFTGPEDAKLVVVEFSDFECPYCGAAAGDNTELITKFKEKDPTWTAPEPYLRQLAKDGKIKLVFRDFPLSFHAHSKKAAEASQCAFEQGKYWEYHDTLFANQGALTVDDLKGYAVDLSLNTSQFNTCLDTGKYTDEVQADLAEGAKLGVQGTPTYIVGDQALVGAQPESIFKSLIEAKLTA